jgi:hypothetical protein
VSGPGDSDEPASGRAFQVGSVSRPVPVAIPGPGRLIVSANGGLTGRARAVVRPFGWRTLSVPGEGVVCWPPYPELLSRSTGKRRGQVYVGPRLESGRGDDPSATHPWGRPPPGPWFSRGPADSTPGAGSCRVAYRVGSGISPSRGIRVRGRPRWWVHSILVQILRLRHCSIHLQFQPILSTKFMLFFIKRFMVICDDIDE